MKKTIVIGETELQVLKVKGTITLSVIKGPSVITMTESQCSVLADILQVASVHE